MNITSTTGTVSLVGGALADTLTATTNAGTAVTLTGGAGADTITVVGGTSTITGGTEADTITGGAVADILVYLLQEDLVASSAVIDSVVGNTGTDILSIGTNATAFTIAATDSFARMQTVETISAVNNSAIVSISLGASAETAGIRTVTMAGASAAAGNIINISTFSAATDTTLTGGSGATLITGGAGNDLIVGGAGIDTVVAGLGNDTITGAAAADNMNGGDGDDTFIFLATVDLFAAGTNAITDTSITGGNGTDSLLVGGTLTAAYAIVNTEVFTGITSVETITGAANTAGISLVLDTTAYTAGIRTINISAVTTVASAISVAEFTVAANGAGLAGINMTGAATVLTSITGGEGADTLTGGTGADILTAGAGNDSIVGGAGSDSITGGTGADTMTGGITDVNTFVFAAGDTGTPSTTNFETITDFTAVAGNLIKVGAQLVRGSASTAAAGMAGLGGADGAKATFNAADTTFAQHLTAVEAALSGNGNTQWEVAYWVEGGTDSYVFIADGVAGIGPNDILIKLTGVTGAGTDFDILTLNAQMVTLA